MTASRRELARERKALSGLIADTGTYIGGLATHYIGTLAELPEARLPAGYHSPARRVMNVTRVHPLELSFGNLLLVEASTTVFPKERVYEGRVMTLRMSRGTQEVRAEIVGRSYRRNPRAIPTTFAISSKGYAAVGDKVIFTLPQEGGKGRYATVEALRTDHAEAYLTALGVGWVIDKSLAELVNKPELTKSNGFRQLLDHWHRVDPTLAVDMASVERRAVTLLPRL